MSRIALGRSCTAVAVVALASAGFAQTIQVNQNNRTIAVTVTDKALEMADIATVHIGFQAYAADSESAYAAGSKTSNTIIDALHKAGIADKDIESENQSVRQNYQFDEKESEADRVKQRFVVSQSWEVHTSATGAKNVLNIAVQAGANSSGQIDWDIKDHDALQARAATKALQHAHSVAEQMAAGLSTHLGALLYASNQVPETPVRPMPMRLEAMGKAVHGIAPLAINPRQIEENATVYAVFAIQ